MMTVKRTAAVEQELVTAHLLLVLSSAQTCKLRKFVITPSSPHSELDGQVSKAISRFTLLTLLKLSHLEVKADTLQVSTQCFVCL